jgi:four helix bundle protein
MRTDIPLLDHESLDVYRIAIEFFSMAVHILEHLPRQRRELRSQLERAAMSIPLNIAEGSGKPSSPDRARYYGIARGSALECGALLDVCTLMGHISHEQRDQGKRLLARVVAMLTRMCR